MHALIGHRREIRPRRRTARRMALVALAAQLAPMPALAHPDGAALDSLNAADLRLASVGYRLATANPAGCATPARLTGLILHELGEYGVGERDLIARHYRLSDGIGVLGIVPGSAADAAGLRAGDEIVRIGDADVGIAPAALPQAVSYARIDRAGTIMAAALAGGVTQLHVRRGDAAVTIAIAGVAGCGGDMVLAPSRAFNAWSDGAHVVVTTRLLAAAADDDELAFIVAHEMAHNNLRHRERLGTAGNGLFASFGKAAARIKETEIEADTTAIGLMSEAGYRLEAATRFLERVGKGRLLDIATTHPGTGRRIGIVTAAIAATRSSQALAAFDTAAWRNGAAPLPMGVAPRASFTGSWQAISSTRGIVQDMQDRLAIMPPAGRVRDVTPGPDPLGGPPWLPLAGPR